MSSYDECMRQLESEIQTAQALIVGMNLGDIPYMFFNAEIVGSRAWGEASLLTAFNILMCQTFDHVFRFSMTQFLHLSTPRVRQLFRQPLSEIRNELRPVQPFLEDLAPPPTFPDVPIEDTLWNYVLINIGNTHWEVLHIHLDPSGVLNNVTPQLMNTTARGNCFFDSLCKLYNVVADRTGSPRMEEMGMRIAMMNIVRDYYLNDAQRTVLQENLEQIRLQASGTVGNMDSDLALAMALSMEEQGASSVTRRGLGRRPRRRAADDDEDSTTRATKAGIASDLTEEDEQVQLAMALSMADSDVPSATPPAPVAAHSASSGAPLTGDDEAIARAMAAEDDAASSSVGDSSMTSAQLRRARIRRNRFKSTSGPDAPIGAPTAAAATSGSDAPIGAPTAAAATSVPDAPIGAPTAAAATGATTAAAATPVPDAPIGATTEDTPVISDAPHVDLTVDDEAIARAMAADEAENSASSSVGDSSMTSAQLRRARIQNSRARRNYMKSASVTTSMDDAAPLSGEPEIGVTTDAPPTSEESLSRRRRRMRTIPDASADALLGDPQTRPHILDPPSDSTAAPYETAVGRMTLLEKMRVDFHTPTGLVKRTYASMLPTLDFVSARGDGWCLMHALQQALPPQSGIHVSFDPEDYIRAITKYTQAAWWTPSEKAMLDASFEQDLSNLRERRSENFSQAFCALLAEMYDVNIFLMGYRVTSDDDMWSLIGENLRRMRDVIPESGDELKAALVDMLFDWGDTEWTIDSLITELIRDATGINGLTDRRIAVFEPIRYSPHGRNATHTAIFIQAGTGGHFDAIRVPEGARLESLLHQITEVARMIIAQQAMLRDELGRA